MRIGIGRAALAAVAVSAFPISAMATPVDSVTFPDGNVLNVQAVVGSGSNASYEVIDFGQTSEPSVAFEYRWNAADAPNGWTMLNALQNAGIGLSVDATYYGDPYDEHFVNNFTYTTGTDTYSGDASQYWQYYNGVYDAGSQTVDWTSASGGPDQAALSDGSFDGWYNSFAKLAPTPAIPETAAPEPSTVALLSLGTIWILRRRRHDRADLR